MTVGEHEIGIGEQRRAQVDDAGRPQIVGEHAEIALEQQLPDQPDGDRRQHHRDQEQGEDDALAAQLVAEQQRQREAEDELDRHGPGDEAHGQREAVPEDRIAHQPAEIVEADEVAIAIGQREAEVGEAGPDHEAERPDQDQQQEDQRRREEQGPDAVVEHAQPRARRPALATPRHPGGLVEPACPQWSSLLDRRCGIAQRKGQGIAAVVPQHHPLRRAMSRS